MIIGFHRRQGILGTSVGQGRPRGFGPARGSAEGGSPDARVRVAKALEALGPGLSDVVFRACCFLEGIETTEKRLGWSARLGKIELKIALERAAMHYGIRASVPEGRAS